MNQDGRMPDEARQGDILAIEDLAISYAHAVDDRDWGRWETLFTPDAVVDYTSAGGIMGNPAELAAWFPEAFAAFEWCMHSMSTHEIRFSGEDEATGRVHVLNRNGVRVDGEAEILDIGAVYQDRYVRQDGRWLFAERIEHTRYIDGGKFAEMLKGTVG